MASDGGVKCPRSGPSRTLFDHGAEIAAVSSGNVREGDRARRGRFGEARVGIVDERGLICAGVKSDGMNWARIGDGGFDGRRKESALGQTSRSGN